MYARLIGGRLGFGRAANAHLDRCLRCWRSARNWRARGPPRPARRSLSTRGRRRSTAKAYMRQECQSADTCEDRFAQHDALLGVRTWRYAQIRTQRAHLKLVRSAWRNNTAYDNLFRHADGWSANWRRSPFIKRRVRSDRVQIHLVGDVVSLTDREGDDRQIRILSSDVYVTGIKPEEGRFMESYSGENHV